MEEGMTPGVCFGLGLFSVGFVLVFETGSPVSDICLEFVM